MSTLKSTAIYLPGLLIPRAASLALIIVMTHFLPKSEYGLMTLVITTGELVDTSLTTWVRLALLRLGAGGAVSTSLARIIFLTVLATTLFGIAASLLLALFIVPDAYARFWIGVATYTIGISFLRYGLALLQLADRSAAYSVLEILRSIISFSLAVLSARLLGANFIYPSLAMGLTTCLFAVFAIWMGVAPLKPSDRPYHLRDVSSFAGPLLVLSVLTIVANTMDRLFLQYFSGAAMVGVYAAAYSLGRQPIDVVANAINTGGYPALVAHYEQGGRAEAGPALSQQLAFFLKFVAPVVCVLYILQNDIFTALLPKGYVRDAQSAFGIVLIGAVAFNLRSAIFDNVFLVERRNILQLKYFIPVFVIGIVIAFVAVPRLGILGTALVFAVWTTLALVMSAIVGRKLIPVTVPWTEIVRVVVISTACAATAAATHALAQGLASFVRLAVECVTAMIAFFGSTMAMHPADTRRLAGKLRR